MKRKLHKGSKMFHFINTCKSTLYINKSLLVMPIMLVPIHHQHQKIMNRSGVT